MNLPATSHRSESNDKNDDSIAWFNGHWINASQLALPLSDMGVRQAVMAVERLRTYSGNVFSAARHLDRFTATTKGLSIDGLPDTSAIESIINELIQLNGAFLQSHGDVGITIFATPGRSNEVARPTLALHLNRIDHPRHLRRRTNGRPVVVTDIVQPPAESWSRQWKVRCRLHYYLADQVASAIDADAVGLLIDADGSVTESSVANFAIVESDRIVSPPKQQILAGVTQSVVESIAKAAKLTWHYAPITPERLALADEILLMGTDTGIGWGTIAASPTRPIRQAGKVYATLQEGFTAITQCPNP